MSKPGDVTVVDRVPYSAAVSPEQAAAYCRHHPRLAGWRERACFREGSLIWIAFFEPPSGEPILVPAAFRFSDYPRRMVEVCDALVALGCARMPSEVLRAMASIRCDGQAPDGDGCFLGPRHDGDHMSHAMLLVADEAPGGADSHGAVPGVPTPEAMAAVSPSAERG